MEKSLYTFKDGVKDGLPIGLGYLAVSIAVGVMATAKGIPVFISLLMSMTSLASAGQYAGIEIIGSATGTFLDIILVQLVINARYFLMSISLSQKIDDSFTLKYRLGCSLCITDEIFGVSMSKKGNINRKYFNGIMLIPYIGWALGTFLGAVAGNVLPEYIVTALTISLYAMFVAIIIPPATKELGVFVCVIISGGLSALFYYTSILPQKISNLSYIICALIASIPVAIIFPKPIPKEEDYERKP